MTYTDPANTKLRKETTYFVVLSHSVHSGPTLHTPTTNAEDPDASPEWSIGDDRHYRARGGTEGWTANPFNMEIKVLGSLAEALLASNTGQSQLSTLEISANELAQPFYAGSNAGGYSLTEIEVDLPTAPRTAANLTAALSSSNGCSCWRPKPLIPGMPKRRACSSENSDGERSV